MATATSAVGAAGLRLDVTDDSSVRAFVRAAVDMFGRIDVVVNNAGLVRVAPLLGHDLAAWREVFAVNVEDALRVIQAAVPVSVSSRRSTGAAGASSTSAPRRPKPRAHCSRPMGRARPR